MSFQPQDPCHTRDSRPRAWARRWHARWKDAVEAGPDAVRKLLLADGIEGDDLRQVAPFAGVLTDAERRLVLAAAAER
jgi:hypothetical protein